MKRWFTRLPIHRKLVVVALVVSTVALVIANAGLVVVDVVRYRSSAAGEAISSARVIAENTAAAVTFEDVEAARTSLETVRVRPNVRRACLYTIDGALFAGFGRSDQFACPPFEPTRVPWGVVTGTAMVTSNERALGNVYVERDLSDLWTRVVVGVLTGLAMLLLAGGAAFLLASRLHRMVSAPIVELAAAARAIRPEAERLAVPRVTPGEDEIGDLVRAFTEMLRRVHTANAEREELLVREREASRLKDEFLAAVSHELRTPLNAIMGWVQILTATKPNEETMRKAIASIARNARAQTRVIADLIDVSRIVTGKLNIRFDPVDLRTVVEHAADVVRSAAQTKNITLQMDVPGAVCLVNGDRDRLQQVIWNLLSNAVKFTPARGRIAVALTPEDSVFEVAVTDSGVGIPASFLPHVFDRFRQADGSTTREHGGLGLGLAIVKELTELHGGTVHATSAGPGQGATFAIRLPQLAGLNVRGPSLPEVPEAPGIPLAGVEILAVDDNEEALEVLASTLRMRGARVRVAASGEDAIRAWTRDPADVLICDLAMPAMDGFEVLRAIRQLDRDHGRPTVALALTAHAAEDYQARTRAAGFEAHIVKPYDAAELVRAVTDATKRAD
jgi:signal transduction histidine kinase